MSGQSVDPFFDKQSISLGVRWRERINAGLMSSTILFPFVSPLYLSSHNCREELTQFITVVGQEQSKRLIIPLLLVDPKIMEDRFSDDELWTEIKEIQYLAIDQLRIKEPGCQEWMEKIAAVAERMIDVVPSRAEVATATPAEDDAEDGGGEGILDRIARSEEELPKLSPTLQRYAQLVEGVGAASTQATPRILAATSFSQRLAISIQLAHTLAPIAEEMESVAQDFQSRMAASSLGIVETIRLSKRQPNSVDQHEVAEFMNSVRGMAEQGLVASSQVEMLSESIDGTVGFSRALDQPLAKIQRALLPMVDARAMFQAWIAELGNE